jgi:carboxyl-terminal processing protease
MKRLVQKVLLPAFLALPALLLLAQKPSADDTDIRTVDEIEEAPVRALSIPENYPRICRRFATIVSSHHLLQKPFDNTISAQAWTNYLRILDYDRSYFTQADIDTFEPYRLRMSDNLLKGDLEFPVKAYELLKKRHGERLAFVKSMLATNIDFSVEESYEWKRKDAPWCRDEAEQDALWRKRVKNDVLSRIVTRDYAESNRVATAAASTNAAAVTEIIDEESAEPEFLTPAEIVDKFIATATNSVADASALTNAMASASVSTNALDLSPEATVLRHYEQSDIIVQDTDAESVIQSYLNAFSMAYDPHTAYMAPAATDDFNIDMNLTLAGIGATLQPEDGAAKVVKVIPGSPCARDTRDIRLMKDDKIIGVGQGDGPIEDITHLPLSKIVKRIRGPKGTKVVLNVISAPGHPSGLETRLVDIIRDDIKLEEQAATGRVIRVSCALPAVSGRKAAGSAATSPTGSVERAFCYVYLPSFYGSGTSDIRDPKFRSCTMDVMKIVARMKPEIEGLVLDLRGNGGGSLREAVSLAGSFIRTGPVVIVREIRNAYALPDRDPAIGFRKPLVVLVDRLSASASEIVAAALQDYGRAVIIGDHATHGKGTVQNVMNLMPADESYGAIRLTCATFHRINGGSTQLRGVEPDIYVPSTRDGLDIGEDKLPNAVPWTQVPPAQYRKVYPLHRLLPTLRTNAQERLAANAEYQHHMRTVEYVRESRERTSVPLCYRDRYELFAKESKIFKEEGLDDIEEGEGESNAPVEEEEPDDGIGKDIVLRASLDILRDLVDLQGDTGIAAPPEENPADWLFKIFK